MAQPPIPNGDNFGVAHPIPGGTRMTTDIPSDALPRTITLAGHSPPPQSLRTHTCWKTLTQGGNPYPPRSFLPPRPWVWTTCISHPCLTPSAPTHRPAPHDSTMKTIKIILKTSLPASTIRPATLLPPTSTLGPAKVEQSAPCPEPSAPT